MKKIRTMFLLGNLSIGGSETKFVRLANRLSSNGHDVHVVALGSPHTLRDRLTNEVSVYCLERESRFSLKNLIRLRKYVTSRRIDTIVCVNPYPLIYGWPLSLISGHSGPKCIASINTSELQSRRDAYFMLIYGYILRRCDVVIFGANRQADSWTEKYRIPKRKITVIHNGVDIRFFQSYQQDKHDLRQTLEIPDDFRVVGCVAQFRPEKSHSTLLDAFEELVRSHGIEAVLLLVGDGPEKDAIVDRARRLGIEGRLRMAGQVDDVRPYLAIMDAFVLPSVSVEVFSNAALEAMSMGVVPICSDVGGATEMIDHGIDGFIFPRKDTEALSKYLYQVLSDQQLAESMRGQALLKLHDKFAVEKMDEAYVRLLSSDERVSASDSVVS